MLVLRCFSAWVPCVCITDLCALAAENDAFNGVFREPNNGTVAFSYIHVVLRAEVEGYRNNDATLCSQQRDGGGTGARYPTFKFSPSGMDSSDMTSCTSAGFPPARVCGIRGQITTT